MATDPLEFKPVPPEDRELAGQLAAAIPRGAERAEVFGLDAGPPPAAIPMWGIYIKDTLSGVGWLHLAPNGTEARIPALVIGNGWWNLGLGSWLLEKLAAEARGRRVTVTVAEERAFLGDMLAEAGFSGPDPEDDSYPLGDWKKRGGAA